MENHILYKKIQIWVGDIHGGMRNAHGPRTSHKGSMPWSEAFAPVDHENAESPGNPENAFGSTQPQGHGRS